EGPNEVWYLAAQQILDAGPAPQETNTMTLTVQAEPVPLRTDEHGVLRVGDSQVLLDTVIEEYSNGSTPEEIVSAYDTLKLADVYAAIAYYLRHQKEVDGYLRARRAAAEKRWQEIEARQPDRANLRARLLARRAQRDQEHASPRE